MAAQRKKDQSINLLPQSDFEVSQAGRVLRWVLTSFRVIVIMVELVVIAGFLSRFWLDLQNSDLTDEMEQKENLILSYESFETEFRLMQKKLAIYSLLTNEDSLVNPLLARAAAHLPEDVQLVSFAKNGLVFSIDGASLQEQSIAQYIANLRSEPQLTGIALSQIESRGTSPLIYFTLETQKAINQENEQEVNQ